MAVNANAGGNTGQPTRAGLYLQYPALREAVRGLKISSPQAYLSAVERGEIEGAPLHPDRVYLASWSGWKDLLWREGQQPEAANADGTRAA